MFGGGGGVLEHQHLRKQVGKQCGCLFLVTVTTLSRAICDVVFKMEMDCKYD